MNTSEVFQIVNTAVLSAWIILLIAPKKKWRNPCIYGFAAVIASIYAFYVLTGLNNFDPAAFGSLAGVKKLFTNDEAVLAGWVHYLVFDLLIGNWIVNESVKHGIKHYLIIPCLFLSFMFGPVGYLLFTIIKISKVKTIA
ncbi:MAG: ABA4-like family protein [Bacteroidota bacterium]